MVPGSLFVFGSGLISLLSLDMQFGLSSGTLTAWLDLFTHVALVYFCNPTVQGTDPILNVLPF